MGEESDRASPSVLRLIGQRARSAVLDALGRTAFGTITSVSTRQPVCAITFDDGPHPHWTPRVLDVLGRFGAKGTFFVLGRSAEKHPGVMRRLVAEGHAVANHSYGHACFPLVDRARRRQELDDCASALSPYGPQRRLFRPPFLAQDLASRLDTWQRGYEVVACSLHASDWEDRDGEAIAHDLASGVKPGAVIMLHDALSDDPSASREAMIDGLEAFLRSRTDLSYVTMPELLGAGNPRREMWLKQPSLATRRRIAS